ncbi:MAG: hypothetical protein ACPGXK_01965 [Phycisphaerae bacterium]
MLTELCERNISVEVHFEDPDTRKISIGRTRLLAMRDDGVVTDQVRFRVGDATIPRGTEVEMHFMHAGQQFKFVTTQLAAGESMPLNEWQNVEVDVWLQPNRIHQVQRRANFRVEMAGGDFESVAIDLAGDGPHPACLLDGRLGRARIMNLSSTGIALLCEELVTGKITTSHRLFVTLDLPGLQEPVCMLVQIRHMSAMKNSDRLIVGGAFEIWNERDAVRVERELTRVIADIERSKIRKAK